jgi:aryl-alcohol dehydrogenase-like predicted oxidoreductase
MEFTTLGRTGLRVGVAGLGCGGGSRLGQGQNKSEAHSIGIVHQALDLGVNFLDTAASYGTEAIVGKAIQDIDRTKVVVSTKHHVVKEGRRFTPDEITAAIDKSLVQLKTDYVDVFHLHGVDFKLYDYVKNDLMSPLLKAKEAGKVRFLGITELSYNDHDHELLSAALDDNLFDVIMLAFNMMNQNARSTVFPKSMDQGVATLIMFAVRSIFSIPGRLAEDIKKLVDAGELPAELAETEDPLGFLIHDGGAESVIDAAYRYVRHDPGADVTLFGTGSAEHLKTNLASILRPALPGKDVEKIHSLFSHLKGVGADFPKGREDLMKRLHG